nr:hypothetical protein [Paraburkholderia sp. PGU19]
MLKGWKIKAGDAIYKPRIDGRNPGQCRCDD